jgi:hypothetical protein
MKSAVSPTPSWPGLTIPIPNFFEATEVLNEDVEMPTASLERDDRPYSQHVAAAPALPQPPRFTGRMMYDRRDFMQKYETDLAAINALQTSYTGAFVMLVGVVSRPRRSG